MNKNDKPILVTSIYTYLHCLQNFVSIESIYEVNLYQINLKKEFGSNSKATKKKNGNNLQEYTLLPKTID